MRGLTLVKVCTILGAVLALVYMVFVMLAPNVKYGKSRMLIPEILIPKPPADIAPGTQPPASVKAKRIIVGAIFFAPFGAMAGLGAGLLLDGARRTLRGFSGKK